MVLIRALLAALCLAALAVGGAAGPAYAHENHMAAKVDEAEPAVAAPGNGSAEATAPAPAPTRNIVTRLVDWLGKIHPFAVHFPIALFPVSLVALVLARRRGEAVAPIRALIIVAGFAAVLSALLGWQAGGFALTDEDPVQTWHRWIGSALALAGGCIALIAWRRRDVAGSRFMVAALALISAALLIQGWLGAVLVHGGEHMRF